MAKIYILKQDQIERTNIDDVEVEVLEDITKKDITCLRKIKTEIEEIDREIGRINEQFVYLQERKTFLQTELKEITKEAEKFKLTNK